MFVSERASPGGQIQWCQESRPVTFGALLGWPGYLSTCDLSSVQKQRSEIQAVDMHSGGAQPFHKFEGLHRVEPSLFWKIMENQSNHFE